MGDKKDISKASLEEREEHFKKRLEKAGRFTYISGFTRLASPVEAIHNACGNTVNKRASALLRVPTGGGDYCEHCVPLSRGAKDFKNFDRAKKKKYNQCDREAGKIFAIIASEGIIRGKDLEYYVKLCVKDMEQIIQKEGYDEEEIYQIVLELVKKRYKKRGIKY